MKHICESLNQFNDTKFFKLYEKEEEVDKKKELQEKEKEGMTIIKKVIENFKRFQSAAGNKILQYKEFWEENQSAKQDFDEGANLYKLFDSNYVIGVLSLPDSAISYETIDNEIESIDEDEEFKIEDGEGTEDLDKAPEASTETPSEPKEETIEGSDLEKPEGDVTEEPAETTPEVTVNDSEVKEYFVVYDMTSERDEIFRCESTNVINAFNDFYENTFKGAMKEMINKYKEKKEAEKIEAEKKEKTKQDAKKREKLDKFLGESEVFNF
jgi:hypothetical protein